MKDTFKLEIELSRYLFLHLFGVYEQVKFVQDLHSLEFKHYFAKLHIIPSFLQLHLFIGASIIY